MGLGMENRLFLAVLLAFCMASCDQAWAGHNEFQAGLAVSGVTETVDWGKNPRKIEVLIDQATALQAIPLLQKGGMLNPDLTQTFINVHPNAVTLVLATTMTALELNDAYTNSNIDQAEVEGIMLKVDDFGHKQRVPLFSFWFDRSIFSKIDWNNFEPGNIAKVSRHFQYSEWANENAEAP